MRRKRWSSTLSHRYHGDHRPRASEVTSARLRSVLTACSRRTGGPPQKSLLDSEPFRQRLESMRLRVCSRQRVLPREFQSCLSYTMLALLAPAWNRVGPYLCQAIANLSSQLADLLRVSKIAHSTLVELCVKEVPIEPMQCFVLPSMRIATAIAVSFKVFSDCPYGSFQELKKFWKNTYGYRIPDETERTMIYVKVRFRTSRDRCYVYPILCVRPREPQPLARINPYPIIGAFLQCVKLRMGQVCGEPFPMVSRSPAFPTPQLRWTAKDAQFDMLNKVNSAVLLAWLCHNNVPCNIKTKKSDILFKITQHAAKG
ncbi:hypothetical protein HPB52_014075 [Rhipicephalus sanguineus]|uniref:DUF4708 domain-containing protein n=1 Tax=Rhipicephalus sanguineus TaxID=34632 RepID=A0A9D4TA94_RHISA|nr:hypothetical protein HPB52_014075 [Rhipicephalus sanguineus]